MHLSRALLQSGQVYYLSVSLYHSCQWLFNQYISVTIGVAIATTTLILSTGFPTVLKPILGSAYIALSSVMTCRVYRFILAVLTDLDSPEDLQLTTNPMVPSVMQPTMMKISGYSPKTVINARVEMDEGVDIRNGG